MRCSDLVKLMTTGKIEEGDKALTAENKIAIKALRDMGGVQGALDALSTCVRLAALRHCFVRFVLVSFGSACCPCRVRPRPHD